MSTTTSRIEEFKKFAAERSRNLRAHHRKPNLHPKSPSAFKHAGSSGVFDKLKAMKEANDDAPVTVEGEIEHAPDYVKAVIEASETNTTDAREFAKCFLQKDPTYSQTKQGLAALLFETWVSRQTNLAPRFVETVVENGKGTFLAIFYGGLSKDDKISIRENTKAWCAFETILDAGDVNQKEDSVSDLTIFEGTPTATLKPKDRKEPDHVKDAHYNDGGKTPDTSNGQFGSVAAEAEAKVDTLDPRTYSKQLYERVIEDGGISNPVFEGFEGVGKTTTVYKGRMCRVDENGVRWTRSGKGMWSPEASDVMLLTCDEDRISAEGTLKAPLNASACETFEIMSEHDDYHTLTRREYMAKGMMKMPDDHELIKTADETAKALRVATTDMLRSAPDFKKNNHGAGSLAARTATLGAALEWEDGKTVAVALKSPKVSKVLKDAYRKAKAAHEAASQAVDDYIEHENVIRRAMKAGKSVPAEVLKDYPGIGEAAPAPELHRVIEGDYMAVLESVVSKIDDVLFGVQLFDRVVAKINEAVDPESFVIRSACFPTVLINEALDTLRIAMDLELVNRGNAATTLNRVVYMLVGETETVTLKRPLFEADEREPTDAEDDKDFSLDDVQAYYDICVVQGMDEEDACDKVKIKFKIDEISVSPCGFVSVPGMEPPAPIAAPGDGGEEPEGPGGGGGEAPEQGEPTTQGDPSGGGAGNTEEPEPEPKMKEGDPVAESDVSKEEKIQMYMDVIDTKKRKGEPIPQGWLDNLAKLQGHAVKDGENEADYIASDPTVFGHPQATTFPKFAYLIPIKFKRGDTPTIEKRMKEAQGHIDAWHKTDYELKTKGEQKNAAGKKAKLERASKNHTDAGAIADMIRTETLPELQRLHKLARAKHESVTTEGDPRIVSKGRAGYDDVHGHVVGQQHTTGRVHYDGRPQGAKIYGDDAKDVETKGRAIIADLKKENAHTDAYKDGKKWEVRIHEGTSGPDGVTTDMDEAAKKPAKDLAPKMEDGLKVYDAAVTKHAKAIVLIRIGDFYEAFDDSAKLLSKTIGLTLTTTRGTPSRPMCGFMNHNLDNYIGRLNKNGFEAVVIDRSDKGKFSEKKYGPVNKSEHGKSVDRDLTHLDALRLRLSHEKARWHKATGKEKEQRAVWVAQCEKEIKGELKFLGLPPDTDTEDMTDDELLAALGETTENSSVPAIVRQACAGKIVAIGQLSDEEKRTLEAYVKKGVLVKTKEHNKYPTPKTVYAKAGKDYNESDEDDDAAERRDIEASEKKALSRAFDGVRKNEYEKIGRVCGALGELLRTKVQGSSSRTKGKTTTFSVGTDELGKTALARLKEMFPGAKIDGPDQYHYVTVTPPKHARNKDAPKHSDPDVQKTIDATMRDYELRELSPATCAEKARDMIPYLEDQIKDGKNVAVREKQLIALKAVLAYYTKHESDEAALEEGRGQYQKWVEEYNKIIQIPHTEKTAAQQSRYKELDGKIRAYAKANFNKGKSPKGWDESTTTEAVEHPTFDNAAENLMWGKVHGAITKKGMSPDEAITALKRDRDQIKARMQRAKLNNTLSPKADHERIVSVATKGIAYFTALKKAGNTTTESRADELNAGRKEREAKHTFKPGHGVGHRIVASAAYTQTSRGFRIAKIEGNQALIVQVADTGLTTSGGNNDRIKPTWARIGDLVRDKKYDGETKAVSATAVPKAPTTTTKAGALDDLKPALKAVAQRWVNTEEGMIDNIAELGEISRDDAVKVFNLYQKLKVFKRSGIDNMNVKHGGFLEKDTIARALAQANGKTTESDDLEESDDFEDHAEELRKSTAKKGSPEHLKLLAGASESHTAALVKKYPNILGGFKPGWNIGKRYDVRVIIWGGWKFGEESVPLDVTIRDKEDDMSTRRVMSTLEVSGYNPSKMTTEPKQIKGKVKFAGLGLNVYDDATKLLKMKQPK